MKKYLLIFKNNFNSDRYIQEYDYYFQCVKKKRLWESILKDTNYRVFVAIVEDD